MPYIKKVKTPIPTRLLNSVKHVINTRFEVDINSRNKETLCVQTRWMYYAWVKENTELSLVKIANSLDAKHDHTNVMHALEKHEEKLVTSDWYKKHYENLQKELLYEK